MSAGEVELRQLRALAALVEEGTFTDAALRLGVTQSAVSRSLAALEGALGVELVRRTTRSAELTDAGRRAHRAALDALAAVDEVTAAARGETRPLRLGYAWSALGRHTSPVLRQWRAVHPDVPLEVHRVDARDAGLARRLADVAVVRGGVDTPDVVVRRVFREPRVVALAVAHPLAGEASLTLPQLTGELLLTTAYGTTTLELWPPGIRPARSTFVDNTDEWLTEIAGGTGIGVSAESTAAQHAHPGVAYVPLDGVPPIDVHLVWPRRGAHPAVEAFAALVADVVAGVSRPSGDGAG